MKNALVLAIALIGLPLLATAQPLRLSDVQMDVVAGGFVVYHGLTDAERAALLPIFMQHSSTPQPGDGAPPQIFYPTFQIGAITFSFQR